MHMNYNRYHFIYLFNSCFIYVLRDRYARILKKLLNICGIGKLVPYEIYLKKYIFIYYRSLFLHFEEGL